MKRTDIIVKQQYMRNLLPMIFSMLGGTINTFIDSVFVSRIVGSEGLAAVNMCLPIYLIMCAIGALIGSGASVQSSHRLGRDNVKGAYRIFHISFTLLISIGGIITILGCSFCGQIARFLSQNGSLYSYVYDYAFYTFLACIPNLLVYIAVDYLQLEGKIHDINIYMTLIVGLDVLFDFVFMSLLHMGMSGAALASLASLSLSCIYAFVSLSHGFLKLIPKLVKPAFHETHMIVKSGLPIALGNICDTVKVFIINSIILRYYGTTNVFVLSILSSISELSICITSGVSSAAGPMIANYYSARENTSIRSLMKLQFLIGSALTSGFAICLIIFNHPIAMLFSYADSLLLPLLCLGISCVLDIFGSTYSSYINMCEKPLIANLLVISRRLLIPVLSIILVFLTRIYLWSYLPLYALASDVFIIIVICVVLIVFRQKEFPLTGMYLLDDHLEKENKVLDFSVSPDNISICEAAEQIAEFCQLNKVSTKLTLKLEMAIEEMATIYVQKNKNLESVDLRAFALPGSTGIRIRCAGIPFNPFEADDDDDMLMGAVIIKKIATVTKYMYVLGLNNISIFFDTSESAE